MKHGLLLAVTAVTAVTLASVYTHAAEPWSPGQYPSYCTAVAKDYASLPPLTRDKNYQSPAEPVVNYNRIESDEPSVMNEVSNALNAFGSMVAYGGAMAASYDKAARAYWAHLDRTGKADPALVREYAYWVWRRWRFDGEVGALRAGYFQTGAGAAKFLADQLGSTFAAPNGVDNMKAAQIYDWNKYSKCSLKFADNVDAALKYEVFLDNYPNYLERVSYVLSQIGSDSLTAEQKGFRHDCHHQFRHTTRPHRLYRHAQLAPGRGQKQKGPIRTFWQERWIRLFGFYQARRRQDQ